jgi:hypothetical protein
MRAPNRFTLLALVLAVVGALVAAFAPTYMTCETVAGGAETCHRSSGITVNGAWILVVSAVPVAVALVPVLVRRHGARVASAILLWACCVVAIASIGMFFLPAAIAMTVAASLRDPEPIPAG